MKTVLLRADGPLQAWGTHSRFELRDAGTEVSKSGVIGLIANALGVMREDDAWVKRLAACWMAVRVDREGRSIVDFHTVGGGDDEERLVHGTDTAVLTQREYISDASFLVALGFDDHALADEIDAALKRPKRPLYLGRKACPTSPHLRQGVVDADPETALRAAPWPSTERPENRVRLVVESPYGQGEPREDQPVSFRPNERRCRRRWVTTQWIPPEDVQVPEVPDPPADVVAPAEPAAKPPPPAWHGAVRRLAAEERAQAAAQDAEVVAALRATGRQASYTVWLTRAFLNPQSADVAKDLEDVHGMHRRVMSGFPQGAPGDAVRARYGVLHCVDHDPKAGMLALHVQSVHEPIWREWPEGYVQNFMGAIPNPLTTATKVTLRAGDEYDFQMRATHLRPGGPRYPSEEWIAEVASRSGFDLRRVQIVSEATARGLRPNAEAPPDKLTFASVMFRGRLRVVDPEPLCNAIVQGIGRGKAFGFGLLRLAPAS